MSDPKVSVILCHHLNENDDYLRLCLDGLEYSKGIAFETILITSAQQRPRTLSETALFNLSVLHDPTLDTPFKKLQVALPLANPKTTHYLFLTDDVIVSEHCIADLYRVHSENFDPIVIPMSNSDHGSRYIADLSFGNLKGQLFPDMSKEDFHPSRLNELKKFPRGRMILIGQPWVSFFCTMFSKKLWEDLGGYDPALEWRHNDQDFCMRAAQKGTPSLVNLGAFAFHFGSRTLRHVKDETKRECTEHFMRKWNAASY